MGRDHAALRPELKRGQPEGTLMAGILRSSRRRAPLLGVFTAGLLASACVAALPTPSRAVVPAAAAVPVDPITAAREAREAKDAYARAKAEWPDYCDVGRAPRHVRRALLEADALVNHDRRDKAIALLERHLVDHPDEEDDLLHLHLAQDLADAGRTAEARDHYRRAAELEPRLDRAWFGLADASYDLQDYATAADAFARGYEASFERAPQALFFAASAWLLADQPDKALPIFERLTGPDLAVGMPPGAPLPELDIKWSRGFLAAANQVEKPELAGPAVKYLMDLRPADPEVWYLQYQYEAARRDFSAAVVSLRVVGYLRPLSTIEEKQLADLLMVAGASHLACEHYERSLDPAASTAEVERLASALVTAHETAKALQVLRAALEKAPDARLWSLVGDVHYLRQEYAEALDAFHHVAEAGDETGRAWLMEGYCALELGRKNEALDLLAKASSFPEQQDLAQRLIQRALQLKDS
jgi:tetratricopeptide (TPR) repeat protein